MLTRETLEHVVARARFAPSVHNVQPARWRLLSPEVIEITAAPQRRLPAADPRGMDIALSCGAAGEATRLALSALGIGAVLEENSGPTPCLHLRVTGSTLPDPLHEQLEKRVTYRGGFAPDPRSWRSDLAMIVQDAELRDRLLLFQDQATARVLADPAQRAELLHWMRLTPWHPDRKRDGMARPQLAMGVATAAAAQLALGPMWQLVERLGLAEQIGDERMAGKDAAAIAVFCRPVGESPVASGVAYLRLWLEATALGWAGWPMAAISDDPHTRYFVREMFSIPRDQRLVQLIRFGRPLRQVAPSVRLPVAELII